MKSKLRSKRKPSGGRYKAIKKKRLREVSRDVYYTKLDKKKLKIFRGKSGIMKRSLLSSDEANVFDGKKYQKVKIMTVVDNKANRHFVRRNIITKGAIIQTELGNAKVVNRPGQEGHITAVLVK